MRLNSRALVLGFVLALTLCLGPVAYGAQALVDKPLWQVGLGGGAGVAPHYPASDQSSLRVLIFPTAIYRGSIFRSDDEGTRARMLRAENFELDFSGAASFPVSESENEARRGMTQLDWIGEVGPRANWRFKFDDGRSTLRFSLPARTVFSSDGTSTAHRGYVLEPAIAFDRKLEMSLRTGTEIHFQWDASLTLIDQKLASYFFSVAPLDVTSTRAPYDARAGLLSLELGGTFFASVEKATFLFGVRNSIFAWSANRTSPLHKSDSSLTIFAGLNVRMFESADRASD